MGLKLKGIEYEYIEQDFKNKSPLLLQHNPIHKKVPVLVHNGKSIIESAIILEYIDQVWEGEGAPILPKDPYQRAIARFWANFIHEKCVPATRKVLWSRGEEREKAAKEAEEALKILECELKGKKFFGDDHIGYVDIFGCFIAYWLRTLDQEVGLDLFTQDKLPNLCGWADDLCDHSFIKENLPDKERLVARLHAHAQTTN
ncbi:glutathione S-transferase TAU 8 [Perilla frutescens var. frutescens]|nr:glutathione S-transferase TAU 8 [Perilla frutescens var. frutescens]